MLRDAKPMLWWVEHAVTCLCLWSAAGRPGDAVGVCAHELGDPGLAALLARLLDGCDGGPLLRHLLQSDLLPGAPRAPPCVWAALGFKLQGSWSAGRCCAT